RDDLIFDRLQQIEDGLRSTRSLSLLQGAGDVLYPKWRGPQLECKAAPGEEDQLAQNLVEVGNAAARISHHVDNHAIGVLLEKIDLALEYSQSPGWVRRRKVGNPYEANRV